jgi:bifunctional DNA-binding transcriptional regulator/antitoxin component of YhaV-PrlF toxin-antitoxin module
MGVPGEKGCFEKAVTHGSVVARFLNNDQVVVIPDGNRDAAGHHAGDSLEIIHISQGRVVRNIRPKKFGPTGVLIESSDGSHDLVESIYASRIWFGIESTNPKHFSHQLIMFAKDGTPRPWFHILSRRSRITDCPYLSTFRDKRFRQSAIQTFFDPHQPATKIAAFKLVDFFVDSRLFTEGCILALLRGSEEP